VEKEKEVLGPNPIFLPVQKSIYKAKTEKFFKIALSVLARNTKVNIEEGHTQELTVTIQGNQKWRKGTDDYCCSFKAFAFLNYVHVFF